jgi:hypothetical protein
MTWQKNCVGCALLQSQFPASFISIVGYCIVHIYSLDGLVPACPLKSVHTKGHSTWRAEQIADNGRKVIRSSISVLLTLPRA